MLPNVTQMSPSFFQCNEREQRGMLTYFNTISNVDVNYYLVIVIGRKRYLEIVDELTEKVQVEAENVYILYHGIDYDTDPYFLMVNRHITNDTFGVVLGLREEIHF